MIGRHNGQQEVRRRALFIGTDPALYEELATALGAAYLVTMEPHPPSLWPEDIQLVLIEATDEGSVALEYLNRALAISGGVAPFMLLREKNADFILKATRLGAQGFIEVPTDIPNVLSLVHMEERRRRGQGGIVSTFFSLKGGVGTTTLAVNAAHHLNTMTAGRTVVVDLNLPLGDVAFFLNVHHERTYSISDFIHNLERFDERLIYDSLTRHSSGLYLLGLPKHFEDLDNLTPSAVRAALNTLRLYFDHVVIDGASDLNPVMLTCLDDSDNIVLVAEPSLASLRAAQAVYDLSQRLGYPERKLKLVLNRHTAVGEEAIEVVLEKMELPVSARIQNSYLTFLEAMNEGLLLHEHQPDCSADQQISAVAHMLHQGLPFAAEDADVPPPAPAPRLRRLFSWRHPARAS